MSALTAVPVRQIVLLGALAGLGWASVEVNDEEPRTPRLLSFAGFAARGTIEPYDLRKVVDLLMEWEINRQTTEVKS